MATESELNSYPARLDIDYPVKLNRLTTFFRLFWAIPILVILVLLTASATGGGGATNESENMMVQNGSGIIGGLFAATALMILFRLRYPRWWFDFALELHRFSARVSAYLLLMTDQYPSTVESQTVRLELDYPDVQQELNRWLPLVKWLLAIPHYIVLVVLVIGVLLATVVAWFSILFTGRYPKVLFEFVLGVSRWNLRVSAYSYLLITDNYPPFSLK